MIRPASTVLQGEAAFLVASQAELLGRDAVREIYRLRTAELRLAIYDVASRRLHVFDAEALAALISTDCSVDLHLEGAEDLAGQLTNRVAFAKPYGLA